MSDSTVPETIQVSPELVGRLQADWSAPVLFKIENGEFILQTFLGKVETAGALAAVAAVLDSCPGGPPLGLESARRQLQEALDRFNAEQSTDDEGGPR